MEKAKNNMMAPIMVLVAICLVASAMLAGIFQVASPIIEARSAAEAEAAKAEYEAIYGKAVEVARQLMAKPGCALASAKAAINKAANESVEAGKTQETIEFTLLFDTHDQKEGMAAMIEKRDAVFTNN